MGVSGALWLSARKKSRNGELLALSLSFYCFSEIIGGKDFSGRIVSFTKRDDPPLTESQHWQ